MDSSTSLDSDTLRIHLPQINTKRRISRDTLCRLAEKLGLKSEEDVLHYAVLKLSRELLANYKPDDGLPINTQVVAIRKAAGDLGSGKVVSKLL